MATRYTLAVDDYVWVSHPNYWGRRLVVIVYLYSRGQHDEHARVRLVRWTEAQGRGASFLVHVSAIDECTVLEPSTRAILDPLNQQGAAWGVPA
jgi:hypothetical protein